MASLDDDASKDTDKKKIPQAKRLGKGVPPPPPSGKGQNKPVSKTIGADSSKSAGELKLGQRAGEVLSPQAGSLLDIKAKLKPTTTIVRPHPTVASGVEQFGKDFLGEEEEFIEEATEKTVELARVAAETLRGANHVVVHTGAGISTSAGVGDFRGAAGVWTQLSKGIIPDDSFDITACVPTFAHMAIKALVDARIVKSVISTNHDGLHAKSGLIIGDNLHELHGNVYVERCVRCFKDYQHTYPVLRTADRFTGRYCTCGGMLWDSGVDFGQTLPQSHVLLAETTSKKADVHIVLGSSLSVAPSSLLPRQYGGKLILVKKGTTPVDRSPAGEVLVRSYGQIDEFMRALVEALGVSPSPAPTVAESGFISITMLLSRRWALREKHVKALAEEEALAQDREAAHGWSRHIDAESGGIDYWFHSSTNIISFGRPVDEEDDSSNNASKSRPKGKSLGKGIPPPPPGKGKGKGQLK